MKAVFVRAMMAATMTTCLTASVAFGQAGGATRPPVGGAGAGPSGGTGSLPATGAAPNGTNVAVIDIAYIFKKHNKFLTQMEGMKTQIEQFEGSLKTDQKKFEALRDELQAYKPSSPEFKQKEETLAKMQSELQVKMALKRKEFLEQEAKVYFNTYNEIVEKTAAFADRNRIGLVLRYNSEEMDAQDRGSVLQGVNRPVVFQRNLDITDIVLQACNVGTKPPPTTTTNPAGPVSTRPGGAAPATGTKSFK